MRQGIWLGLGLGLVLEMLSTIDRDTDMELGVDFSTRLQKNAEENPFLTRRTNPPFRLKQE